VLFLAGAARPFRRRRNWSTAFTSGPKAADQHVERCRDGVPASRGVKARLENLIARKNATCDSRSGRRRRTGGRCLAHAGASVTLIVRREALERYPKQIRLEKCVGNFTVEVEYRSSSGGRALDTVKATQLEPALRRSSRIQCGAGDCSASMNDHVAVAARQIWLWARDSGDHAGEMERVTGGILCTALLRAA